MISLTLLLIFRVRYLEATSGGFSFIAMFSNRYSHDFRHESFGKTTNLRMFDNRRSYRTAIATDKQLVTFPFDPGRPA